MTKKKRMLIIVANADGDHKKCIGIGMKVLTALEAGYEVEVRTLDQVTNGSGITFMSMDEVHHVEA